MERIISRRSAGGGQGFGWRKRVNAGALVAMLIAALLLTGCQSPTAPSGPQTVVFDGMELVVDMEARQVTHGEDVYRFSQSEDQLVVVYPNGEEYTRYYVSEYASSDHYDSEADFTNYLDFDILEGVIDSMTVTEEQHTFSGENILVILLGIVFIVFGVFAMGNAEGTWQMNTGWQFKNAEPSDLALAMTTIGGIVALIAGIALIIGGLFL